MATVSQIRTALATRLATIPGLTTYATIPATPQAPCVLIRPDQQEYDLTLANAADTARYELTLLAVPVGSPFDIAQDIVDAYLPRTGTYSIKAAIEGDKTLGGVVDAVRVTGWREYGSISYGGTEYFGVRFAVEVWPR